MKYLIAGLGNVGAKYENTRHNIGFLVLDELARRENATWRTDQLGDVTEIKHRGRTLILLKPSTYMNRSGKAVRYWMQKEKLDQSRLLVVIDDLNLPLGTQRLRGKGSDGGHNGLRDIDQLCGGNNYARLRIGIGNEFSPGRQVNYVLGEWTNDEAAQLPEIIGLAADTVQSFAAVGVSHTMTQYNRKG